MLYLTPFYVPCVRTSPFSSFEDAPLVINAAEPSIYLETFETPFGAQHGGVQT
jgi:hypothetical protein